MQNSEETTISYMIVNAKCEEKRKRVKRRKRRKGLEEKDVKKKK